MKNTTTDKKEILQRTANETNTFARQIKKNLSINDLRVLFYTIAQIDSCRALEPGEQEVVTISIKDYLETLTSASAEREGKQSKPAYARSGKLYQDVKESAKRLAALTSFIEEDQNHFSVTNIIEKVDVDKLVGNIEIKFTVSGTKMMHPENGEPFTKIKLLQILKLNFAPSINLYEFCYSYIGEGLNTNTITLEVEELRYIMGTTYLQSIGRGKEETKVEYPTWKDFNVYVLKKAVDEINKQTDITIKTTPIRTGRQVGKVKFEIKRKPKYGNPKSVIPGQVTIDDLKPEIEVIGKPQKRKIEKQRDFGFSQREEGYSDEFIKKLLLDAGK